VGLARRAATGDTRVGSGGPGLWLKWGPLLQAMTLILLSITLFLSMIYR
jgi:hypothetical protein